MITQLKSSFVNSLETDLFDLNPFKELVILSFNYEMLSSRQVGRKLSYKLHLTTSDLYSGNSSSNITETKYKEIEDTASKIAKYPIYYVDVPGNVEEMRQTIFHFCENEGKNKWVIIILDHTLLTKGLSGESERETLAQLQYMFMEVKKYNSNTIIQLSQMNRDIESVDRIQNVSMHFPMRKDIFGGDSIFQGSDYVIVIHRPELLLKNMRYGPDAWPIANMIYLHFLKNREGDLGVIPFINNLKYNRIDEELPPEIPSVENSQTTEESLF
jgi:replicative DNA helicase